MNQDQPELTLEESIKQVMQTLPPIIRDYLSQGKYTPIARNLMAKYGLRIDQGGILERGMMLLLMGIEDPSEFSKTLIEEAKLDQQAVDGIMQDVNMQIFMPLREEMQKGAPAATANPPRIPTPPPPPPQKLALRETLATVLKSPQAQSNLPSTLPSLKPVIPNETKTDLKPVAPVVPAKPYAIDPYREPIDEK